MSACIRVVHKRFLFFIFYFGGGGLEVDVLFRKRYVGQLLSLILKLSFSASMKVRSRHHSRPSLFNCSRGLCDADMVEISDFVGEQSERFMWWRLVINYLHKSFDNGHSQALAFR